MAESTAGIGEAGALINKASAPSGMDITRGLQMAERTALKKAQAEAAKEAKKQAKMAAMDKYRTIKTGLYKDPSVNEEAKKLAREFQYEMEVAYAAGDINAMTRLSQDAEFLKGDLKIKDAFLTSLAPDKKKVDTSSILKAAREGKINEYLETQSPLIKDYFLPDSEGNIILTRPDKVNFDREYDEIVSGLGSDYVDAREADFGRIKMTKQVPSNVLMKRARAYVESNPQANSALDFDPEFQKVFKEQYKNDLSRELEAKENFVFNKLKQYNEPRYQMGSKSRGGNFFSLTADGFSIGKYNFSVIPTTTTDLVKQLTDNEYMFGNNVQKSNTFLSAISRYGDNEVNQVVTPQNARSTFLLNDPNMGQGVRRAKPLSIIQIGKDYKGSKGKMFLTYRDETETKGGQIVEFTPDLLAKLSTYYETTPQEFIEAYAAKGIDLSVFAPKGNINTNKGGSTKKTEPAKEKKEEGYMVNGKLIKPRGK